MFKNFFSNLYVASMQKISPSWVVKNKTTKTNQEACLWLMGAEKELLACHHLQLSEAEIAERMWSWDTRVAFLKDENYACIDDLSTGDELNVVLSKAECDLGEVQELQELSVRKMTPDILVRAMRRRTPGAEALKRLISSLNVDALLEVADRFPKAFNDLKPYEVLGLNSPEDAPIAVSDKRWYLASLLVKKQTKLAIDFIELLNNIPEGKMAGKAKEMWDEMFEICLEKNFNLSDYIIRFFNEDEDKYVRLRTSLKGGEFFACYFNKMFYHLVKKHYDKEVWPGVTLLTSQVKENPRVEAHMWMHYGIGMVSSKKVFHTFFYELDYLEKVLDGGNFRHLLSLMSKAFYNLYQGVELLKRVTKEEDLNNIRERLILICSAGELTRFFPFTKEDWTLEQVKQIIRKLVDNGVFPVERITELNDGEIKFAKEEILTYSQKLVLSRKYDEECRDLIKRQQLTPDAECYLLGLDSLKYVKKTYIETRGLSMKAFKHLLGMNYTSYECKDDYLLLYAQKCGLTEEQWMLIAQSNMASIASQYSEFVKKQK